MVRSNLDLVSFPSLDSCHELCAALESLSYDVRTFTGSQWLTDNDAVDNSNARVLYLSSQPYPRQRILARLRETPAATTLAVAASGRWDWDEQLLSRCHDVLLWPCLAGELDFRVRRIAGHNPQAPCDGVDGESLDSTLLGVNLVGRSPAFLESLRLMRRIARCQAPTLISGETGTGKELAARAVHYLGVRNDQPFVPLNCGAVPDELFENELFGHERGAYTDAKHDSIGVIGRADGGTLFLDEIDTLSPKAQVALLRFLQDQQYTPLGGNHVRHANVRIIAATNADIGTLVANGEFRRDLYFRINILVLPLPPLRDRAGDIPVLADHYIRKFCEVYDQPPRYLHRECLFCMEAYDWPGNVRELENVIHRAFLLSEGDTVTVPIPLGARQSGGTTQDAFADAKAMAIAEFERTYLNRLMRQAQGNVSRAARLACKERRALGKLLKKHGMDGQGFRAGPEGPRGPR